MTDQIPRPMNKTPPAIRINWSPLPRVTASAPPIVAPIAVAAVRHGHVHAQQVLRENSVSIWASEPEPLSVNPHLHILDQRLHPRSRLDRSLEGGRILPSERHADVLMENGTQLDPGLESGAVSIGSGEVTTCGISSHDLPESKSVDRHKCR